MNTELLTRKPWFALALLVLAYAVLGWHLSAHHIFWLVGTFVIGVTLVTAWKSHPILESLVWFATQKLLVVVGLSMLFSVAVTLILTKPVLLNLTLLPLLSLLYAELEMRATGFKQMDVFFCSVLMAGLGLLVGEAVDLWVIPSMRY
uniref:hypothetical protein n=1 Tax=Trichocoleus desertorum TaxID=1481672 RepID=UPI0025B4617F|nr:hypothetical protein [Trichocoleus desertorum]